MTQAAFARELATRLSAVLPRGFSARVDDDPDEWVWIDSPDGHNSGAWIGMIQERPDDPARFSNAAENVLSQAQDVVSETTGDPWPRASGPRLDLALPGNRLDGNVLHIWYGDEHHPALRLFPIDIGAS